MGRGGIPKEGIGITLSGDGLAIFRDAPRRIKQAVHRGLDEAGSHLVEALQETAPGKDLKASIAHRRLGFKLTVGAINSPPPWASIAETGGEIKARYVSFYFHNKRQTFGPFLQIPLRKEFVGLPGVRFGGPDGGVKREYDPASKTVGEVIAVLKRSVYHPPANRGRGWLGWVVEREQATVTELIEDQIDAEFRLQR